MVNITLKESPARRNLTPKHILANSKDLVNKLLRLLADPRTEVVDTVWDFLVKLPRSDCMRDKLSKLAFNNFMDYNEFWRECLEMNECRESVAYSLYGFINALHPEKLADAAYLEKLSDAYCFEFMYSIFKETFVNADKKMKIRCVCYCIDIMNLIWNERSVRNCLTDQESEKSMWNDITGVLTWILRKGPEQMSPKEISETLNSCIFFLVKVYKLNERIFRQYIYQLHMMLLSLGIVYVDI